MNMSVRLDGVDNSLAIDMDTLRHHWTVEAWVKPDQHVWKDMEVIIVKRGEGTFAVIFGNLQNSRIDYIYYKGKGIRAISSKIIRTTAEIDDVWPSDHAAVLTTFEIIE